MADQEQAPETAPEPTAEQRRRRTRWVPVQVIRRSGQAVLAQIIKDGSLRRFYIPASEGSAKGVSEEALERSTPYGIAWAEFFDDEEFGQRVERELRRVNIWTLDDLALNTTGAATAFLRSERDNVYRLIRRVKETING